jgi:F0F1-type ATP synthase assembly protein I
MVPIVAWLIGRLDRYLIGVSARPLANRSRLLFLVSLVVVAAGLVDLVWGGAFTYVARAGTRILILLALFLVIAWPSRRVGFSSTRVGPAWTSIKR